MPSWNTLIGLSLALSLLNKMPDLGKNLFQMGLAAQTLKKLHSLQLQCLLAFWCRLIDLFSWFLKSEQPRNVLGYRCHIPSLTAYLPACTGSAWQVAPLAIPVVGFGIEGLPVKRLQTFYLDVYSSKMNASQTKRSAWNQQVSKLKRPKQ